MELTHAAESARGQDSGPHSDVGAVVCALLFKTWMRRARINGMHNEASSRVMATVTDSHFLIPLGVFFVGLVLLIALH